MALSFCEADERTDWHNIEKLTRQEIPIVEGHPYESRVPFTSQLSRAPAPQRPQPQSHSHGRRDLPSAGGGGGKRRRRRSGRGTAANA